MIPFPKCPICNNNLHEKEVEKILYGGGNTAVLRVKAEVCYKCGERLYSNDTVKMFEGIREKLKNKNTDDFEAIGQTFKITISK